MEFLALTIHNNLLKFFLSSKYDFSAGFFYIYLVACCILSPECFTLLCRLYAKIICSVILQVGIFTFDDRFFKKKLFLIKIDILCSHLYKTAVHVSRLLLKGIHANIFR